MTLKVHNIYHRYSFGRLAVGASWVSMQIILRDYLCLEHSNMSEGTQGRDKIRKHQRMVYQV